MAVTPTFTILVVDENPAVRLFVDLAVGADDVRVVSAADGHAAIDCVDQTRPDLVLAATGMATMGGHDLAARLSGRNVPVVLVAGSLDRIGVESGAAAAGILTKPLQVEQLRELVSRMLTDRQRVPASPELDDELAMQDPEESDVIDAWLCDADSALGMVPRQWRALAAEAGDLRSFAHDVASFRTGGVVIQRLQFTHASL